MSAPLNMDPAQIAANAATLQNLVQQRVQSEQQVSSAVQAVADSFTGEAASAFQAIMQRFMSASEGLRREEQAIAEKLDAAQKAYTASDTTSADSVGSSMGL